MRSFGVCVAEIAGFDPLDSDFKNIDNIAREMGMKDSVAMAAAVTGKTTAGPSCEMFQEQWFGVCRRRLEQCERVPSVLRTKVLK